MNNINLSKISIKDYFILLLLYKRFFIIGFLLINILAFFYIAFIMMSKAEFKSNFTFIKTHDERNILSNIYSSVFTSVDEKNKDIVTLGYLFKGKYPDKFNEHIIDQKKLLLNNFNDYINDYLLKNYNTNSEEFNIIKNSISLFNFNFDINMHKLYITSNSIDIENFELFKNFFQLLLDDINKNYNKSLQEFILNDLNIFLSELNYFIKARDKNNYQSLDLLSKIKTILDINPSNSTKFFIYENEEFENISLNELIKNVPQIINNLQLYYEKTLIESMILQKKILLNINRIQKKHMENFIDLDNSIFFSEKKYTNTFLILNLILINLFLLIFIISLINLKYFYQTVVKKYKD
ncbi:MAG: hypothetical protein CMI96_04155 [Pelagibacteraceae bacterium]|nr:hypothetical protein [Pelagibacteraceae bacterium]|tara:strand:+ start:10300 stop:11355 length:1056 start_codon:yes stop_codon:yes gene_type:complete